MDRWFLFAAALLAMTGGVCGMISVHRGNRSGWTVFWMLAVFFCQIAFLWLRGRAHEACPLAERGEILVFLSWSLTSFYLLIGPPYRISLMGVFTAPVVAVFQFIALLPGMLKETPEKITDANVWHGVHCATSVLAYGALALAAVAGVMFLVLDRQLKEHHLSSGLFRNLPPVRELLISLGRLLVLGWILLSFGILAAFGIPMETHAAGHHDAALLVWGSYTILLVVKMVRGIAGRWISRLSVGLFLLSLAVFFFV